MFSSEHSKVCFELLKTFRVTPENLAPFRELLPPKSEELERIQSKIKKWYYNNLNMDYFDYICQIMTNYIVMMFAQRIKTAREEKGLLQKELATALHIDVPMYSRIERGDRNAKREQVLLLSHLLSIEQEELLTLWIADKVNAIIDNENEVADKALRLITMSRYGNEY